MSFFNNFFNFSNKNKIKENELVETDKDINGNELSEYQIKIKNILKKYIFEDKIQIDKIDDEFCLYDIMDALIYLNENKKILSISFAVYTRNDIASKLSVLLSNIEIIDKFEIIESHYIENGAIVSGDEAFIKYDEYVYSETANDIYKNLYFNDVLVEYDCENIKEN